jgi:hypothetical protein
MVPKPETAYAELGYHGATSFYENLARSSYGFCLPLRCGAEAKFESEAEILEAAERGSKPLYKIRFVRKNESL